MLQLVLFKRVFPVPVSVFSVNTDTEKIPIFYKIDRYCTDGILPVKYRYRKIPRYFSVFF